MAIGYFVLNKIGIHINGYIIVAIRLVCFLFIIIQSIKRLQDIGLSGWFTLVGIVPFLRIVFFIWLCIQDGSAGENQYGEDPKGREKEEDTELDF